MPGYSPAVAMPIKTLNQAAPVCARLGALSAGRKSVALSMSKASLPFDLATPANQPADRSPCQARMGCFLQTRDPDSRSLGLQGDSATLAANGNRPTNPGEIGT